MHEKTAPKASPAPLTQGHTYDVYLKLDEISDGATLKEIPTKGLMYVEALDGFYIFRETAEITENGVPEGRAWRIYKGWIVAIADTV